MSAHESGYEPIKCSGTILNLNCENRAVMVYKSLPFCLTCAERCGFKGNIKAQRKKRHLPDESWDEDEVI
jgi:hypothetical protein